MKLGFAFLANAADVSTEGKLSIVGGDIDTLMSPKYPAIHPTLSIIAKVWLTADECEKEHELRIDLVDDTNKQISREPIILPFTVEKKQTEYRTSFGATFVGVVVGIPVEKPGQYTFRIRVDGVELGTLPLFAILTPKTESNI